MSAFRRVIVAYLCALTAVFLLFGPYLADLLTKRNALWFCWQPNDLPVLLGCMGLLAAAAVGGREIARILQCRLCLGLIDHAYVLALGGGLLANLWFHTIRDSGYHIGQYGMETQTAWLLLFAATGYSLAKRNGWLVLGARQLGQVLSPAVAIIALQLCQLPTLPQPESKLQIASTEPRPSALVGHSATKDWPVYLFIFDEWSYPRTYDNGRLTGGFENLARLSRQAITFHNAHAPGGETAASIPSLCRQTGDVPGLRDLEPGFTRAGQYVPANQYPSIFTVAGCTDYRRLFVYWGFDLGLWLRGELDVERAYTWYPRAERHAGQMLLHVYNAAFYWTDPWSALAYEKFKPQVRDRHILGLYESIHADAISIVRDQPARTFAIVHYPLPHHPYLLDADGAYHGPDPGNWDKGNLDGYWRNLQRLDVVVGQIVRALEDAGRFDESMLILTSDHSWRNDPDRPVGGRAALTHVPTIVKLPSQTTPLEIDTAFQTRHLGQLIERGLQGGGTAEIARLVRDLAESPARLVCVEPASKNPH